MSKGQGTGARADYLPSMGHRARVDVIRDVDARRGDVPVVEGHDELLAWLGADIGLLVMEVVSDQRDVVSSRGKIDGKGSGVVVDPVVEESNAVKLHA